MSLRDFATGLERLAGTAHARGQAAAAARVQSELERALAPHRRTGAAEDELEVRATREGLEVDGVRYLPFIKGVPRGEALAPIAAEGYAAGVRAALSEGT